MPSASKPLPLVPLAALAVAAALGGGIYFGIRSTGQPPQPPPETVTAHSSSAPESGTSSARPTDAPPPPPAPPKFNPPKATPPTQPALAPAPLPATATSLADLNAKLESLTKAPNLPQRQSELTSLGGDLAHHLTPDQLADWLAQLDDPDDRRALTRGFLTGLTKLEPEIAAKLALSISALLPKSGLTTTHAIYSVIQTWAQQDPTAAADFMGSLEDGPDKQNGMRALAHQWSMADPAAALAWAMTQDAAGKQLVSQIARTQAQRDAEGAIKHLFEMADGPHKDAYLAGIAPAWVAIDPATAMEAIETISDRSQRISATHQAVVRWAHSDPAAAASWTSQNAPDNLRNALQQNIARAWSSRDPVAALSWAAEQEDLDLRESLVAAAAPQAVWKNPQLAVDTVAALPESRNKEYAVERLINNWAQRDPAAAAAFVVDNKLTAERRGQATADVAYQWGRRDADQTTAWLTNLTPEQGRWNALLGAAAGAAKMTDGRLIGEWRQIMRAETTNEATAREWLNREEIPQSVRDQLLPLAQ